MSDVLSDQVRFDNFLIFIKTLLLGSGDNSTNLSVMSSNYISHNGGGILPFYFYFYLGFVGVFFSSVLLSLYLNRFLFVSDKTGGLTKCLLILIVCTSFRWYLYSPLMLLRGAFFFSVIYCLLSFYVKKL